MGHLPEQVAEIGRAPARGKIPSWSCAAAWDAVESVESVAAERDVVEKRPE